MIVWPLSRVLVISGQVKIFVPHYANSSELSIKMVDPNDR